MTGWLIFGFSAAVGFIIGACYEGCRSGGTIDLTTELAVGGRQHYRSVSPDLAIDYDLEVRYLPYDDGLSS